MRSLTITISEEQCEFIKEQIASGHYATESEVVRDLIRSRQREAARERVDQLLLEGLDGPTTVVTPEDLLSIRQQAREKAGLDVSNKSA